MALDECPDCGRDVSERTAACPHCGRPLGGAGPVGGADRGTTTRPDWLHDRNLGCLAAGVLAVILLFGLRGC